MMNVYNQPQPKRSSVLSVLSSMGSIHDDASLELFNNSNSNTQDNNGNSSIPTETATETETFLPTIFSSLPSSSTSPTRISSSTASSEVVNDNHESNSINEKNTEKVSLEEIRRKSKNLKDLVANFWMHSETTTSPSSCSSNCHNNDTTTTAPSSTTHSNNVHRTACTNNRKNTTGYGISSKKSDESIGSLFGNFHPIDLTAPRSGKSVAATAAAINKQQHDTNTKWIEEPGNRKHSLSGPMFPTKDMFSSHTNISASSISSSFSDAATRVSLNNNINSCTGTSTSTNNCNIHPITTNSNSNSTILNCGNMNNTISNTTSHSNTNIAAVPSSAAAAVAPSTAAVSSYSTCSKNHWTHSSVVETPGQYDIVCGRNSGAYNYIGNRRFRVTIDMNLQRYIAAPTREAKTNVIQAIVRMLHDNIGARFLKKSLVNVADPINGGTKKIARYTVMTEKQAREKVGHALRDLVIAARKEQHHLQHEQQQHHE